MFGSDKKDQEFISQLAIRLAASAHQLSEAARRLQLAELTYREYLVRLRRLDEEMRALIDLLQATRNNNPAPAPEAPETNPAFCEPPRPPNPSRRKLRYSDYIEFSNYAELKKFEKMPELTEKDVADCDTDDLMRKLLAEDPSQ